MHGDPRKMTPIPRITFNDADLVLQAVLQGQGIAQMAGYQVCDTARSICWPGGKSLPCTIRP